MDLSSSLSITTVLRRVVDAVLELDTPHDYWQRQGAMSALIAWRHERGLEVVRSWLDRAVDTQRDDGRLCHGGFTDVASLDLMSMRTFVLSASGTAYFVMPLLDLHAETGDDRYLAAATRQMEAALAGPRTAEGFLLMDENAVEVWVDEVFPVCGPLARLGTLLDRQAWIDEAYAQLRICDDRLGDPRTGLIRHVWCEEPDHFPESTFWMRGIGWFIAAAVDTLAWAPDHPEAASLRHRLVRTLRALAERQEGTGLFRDTVDNPASAPESSGTLMFVYTVGAAVRQGIVAADDPLADAARLGLAAALREVRVDGMVDRCVLPPGGPGAPLGPMVFGQSWLLLAALSWDWQPAQ